MAAPLAKQWGVTPAISHSFPNEREIASNDALIAELKRQNSFESVEETEKRKATLQLIQKVVVQFVKHISSLRNLPQSSIEIAGGKIFTFGSYRLGVYGPGSDIDTLVVVPKHVTREDFFEHVPSLLERMAPPDAIQELTPVPDAYVPIIKLELSGISIDLIFARLELASVPMTLTLKDTSILRGLEDRDLRSLNGTRVTDEILELVPQQKTFRTALRGIKLWAQRRAIYANVMGFPGGVAWAMLVARICQLYPQATGSVIISKFFVLIGSWKWPQPVMLKQIESGPLGVRVWNPTIYPSDKFHLMPIITPAYPSMCATHNITMSTKAIITKELQKGRGITDKIFAGQMQWKDLFTKHTFFIDDYKYYLSVVTSSRTKDAQHVWSGFVESKIRLLVASLETQGSISVARPFNKGFDREHHCKNDEEIEAVLNGDLKYQANNVKTATTDAVKDPKHVAAAQGNAEGMTMPNGDSEHHSNGESKQILYTTTYYVGLEIAQDAKRLDISYQTREFTEMCRNWTNYQRDLNSLFIVHTRNYDLPSDVFGPGEVKPMRPKKKTTIKKRNMDTSGLEVTAVYKDLSECLSMPITDQSRDCVPTPSYRQFGDMQGELLTQPMLNQLTPTQKDGLMQAGLA